MDQQNTENANDDVTRKSVQDQIKLAADPVLLRVVIWTKESALP